MQSPDESHCFVQVVVVRSDLNSPFESGFSGVSFVGRVLGRRTRALESCHWLNREKNLVEYSSLRRHCVSELVSLIVKVCLQSRLAG